LRQRYPWHRDRALVSLVPSDVPRAAGSGRLPSRDRQKSLVVRKRSREIIHSGDARQPNLGHVADMAAMTRRTVSWIAR